MSVSNQMAAFVPFILAAILVGGVLTGSRLPVAQRNAIGWILAIGLIAVALGIFVWLALRSHNPRLVPSIFVPLAILFPGLSRIFVRTPLSRRIFLALGGVMMIGFGFLFSHLLPAPGPVAALQIFRWAMVFCGAFMVVAAWGNWLPPEAAEESDGRLRPTPGYPPRHFGDAS